MRKGFNIGICFLIIILSSCVSVPLRMATKDGIKLSTTETEKIWGNGSDYVEDVMENVKGYKKPIRDDITPKVTGMFLYIAGGLFLFGIACFALAYLTHIYKANVVGFIALAGAGVSVGFAELAPFMWVIPVTAVIGFTVWFLCHRNRSFSLFLWIKENVLNNKE